MWRCVPRLTLVAAVCLALAAVSACSSRSRPFGKGTDALIPELFEKAPPVSIVATKGLPKAKARSLTRLLTAEAGKRGISASRTPPADRSYRMKGTLTAAPGRDGTVVVYVWDVSDSIGTGKSRITGKETIPGPSPKNPWDAVDRRVMHRIALNTADRLSAILGQKGFYVRHVALPPPESFASGRRQTRIASASAQSPQPADPIITGSTGDAATVQAIAIEKIDGLDARANDDVVAAMTRSLSRNGVPIASTSKTDVLRLKGDISVAPPKAGKRAVSIAWTVLDKAGELIGTVQQDNNIPARALDRGWAPIAGAVADAAVDSVIDLMLRAK